MYVYIYIYIYIFHIAFSIHKPRVCLSEYGFITLSEGNLNKIYFSRLKRKYKSQDNTGQ